MEAIGLAIGNTLVGEDAVADVAAYLALLGVGDGDIVAGLELGHAGKTQREEKKEV